MQSLSNHFLRLFFSLFEIFLASFFTIDKSAASCRFFCNNSPEDSITPASSLCLQLLIMVFIFSEFSAVWDFCGLSLSHLYSGGQAIYNYFVLFLPVSYSLLLELFCSDH